MPTYFRNQYLIVYVCFLGCTQVDFELLPQAEQTRLARAAELAHKEAVGALIQRKAVLLQQVGHLNDGIESSLDFYCDDLTDIIDGYSAQAIGIFSSKELSPSKIKFIISEALAELAIASKKHNLTMLPLQLTKQETRETVSTTHEPLEFAAAN